MSRPTNVREALIAEALGDIGKLLERIESVAPAIESSCDAVTSATATLVAGADAAEARFAAFTDHATTQVIRHVAGRTAQLARSAADVETHAMQAAARALFREELAPALQRLAGALDAQANKGGSSWGSWPAHAATAVATAVVTWLGAALVFTAR